MQLPASPFETIQWDEVEATEHAGITGFSRRRICQFGEISVRMVELSPDYLAEHWCEKGHVILCLEGEVDVQLRDGRTFTLRPGMSCQVGDGIDAHRGYSSSGARLFVVD